LDHGNAHNCGVSFEFSRVEIETKRGPRAAVVATPLAEVVVDKARLHEMRRGELNADADREIEKAVRVHGPVQAFVFRARGDRPSAQYKFSKNLTLPEITELAYYFLRAHHALFERLVPLGVVTLIGVDFLPRESAAYREGADRLIEEAEGELAACDDEARAAELRVELWFAERQARWSRHRYVDFVPDRLAEQILLAERSLDRLRKQIRSSSLFG
jgi:hypothetical protein